MEASLALNIGLPVALCIIMLGLGLSLRIEDFIRVIARPWPIFVGLICQLIILPGVCFILIIVSNLPPAISVGMLLLAASPGGPSAALYTHLARGDVALNIAFTAITSVVALISIPVVASIALMVFYGDGGGAHIQFQQILQIFAIAVVPALIGAFIHHRYPSIARGLDRPVRIVATVFLAVLVLFALLGQWQLLLIWGPTLGVFVLTFNVLSVAVAYFVPRILKIESPQAVAIAMSIGIRNAALVIALAMSEYMLGNPEMAIPPAAYGLFSYVVCGAFVWILSRRTNARAAT
ncbi:bile acid:sodium symporter family protein [Pelagibacterium lentulum]|uniref:Transporter n=1 Tax=Pelagibacterium lentulum TaxID=2029865 RepID=A0A916RCN4_9HYPH|nr:bile acid:sodium symporter family protein [Pelagibacterium lentulum]GGA50642.1 transporter [Pelagibacterium lentulum]